MAKLLRGAAGEKALAKQGRPLRRRAEGGPLLAFTLPHCRPGGNGKAVTVTSPPLVDRARQTTLPPQWGCPPKGIGGGGLGLGAEKLCARYGARTAGRGKRGLSEPSLESPSPRPSKRQEAPDFRPHPQTSSAVQPRAGAPGAGTCCGGSSQRGGSF